MNRLQSCTQILEDGLKIHVPAGEKIKGRQTFFWLGVDTEVRLGQQQEAGDTLRLKLVKALGDDLNSTRFDCSV